MPITGRKSDPIWSYFRKILNGKSVRAKCLRCKLEMTGLVARMKAHRNICQRQQIPDPEENIDLDSGSTDSESDFSSTSLQKKNENPKNVLISTKSTVQSNVIDFSETATVCG